MDKQEDHRVHWRGGGHAQRLYLLQDTAAGQAREAARGGQGGARRRGRAVCEEDVATHCVRDRVEEVWPVQIEDGHKISNHEFPYMSHKNLIVYFASLRNFCFRTINFRYIEPLFCCFRNKKNFSRIYSKF
jgi:hypothetical protein